MDATHPPYPSTPFYPKSLRRASYPASAIVPAWYVTSDGVLYAVESLRAPTDRVTPIFFPDATMNRKALIGVAVYFDESLARRAAIARTRKRLAEMDAMIDPLALKRERERARLAELCGSADDAQTA